MRRALRYLLLLPLLLGAMLGAGPATAQSAATLVADQVTLDGQRLTASGHVEAFHEGTRVSARAITYDGSSDQLTITGPILLTTPDGQILTASQASLDQDLRNGLLLGARVVFDQRLQMAASAVRRVEGRYTQLSDVGASSCQVCPGRAPLWEIRARNVIHDAQTRRIWFEGAQFRVKGVPLAYIPRLRMPDPSVDRATGVLVPRLSSSGALGVGISLPYFIALGDHRDLTLTPFVSEKARSLGLRYRQAFHNGDFEATGAASRDDIKDGLRGYLFAEGRFDLAHQTELSFDLELISDDSYLTDYNITDRDRLDSQIRLVRVTGQGLSEASFTRYYSLRVSDDNTTLPTRVGRIASERRLPIAGGTLRYGASFEAHQRSSDLAGDGLDMARLGGFGQWRGRWTTASGLVFGAEAGLDSHVYALQDAAPGSKTSLESHRAGIALNLSYPLVRRGERVSHLISPMVQLGWTDKWGDDIPNEDSTRLEFDQANLMALQPAPGEDLVLTGGSAAIGLSWVAQGRSGWQSRLSFGRILRDEAPAGIARSTGLSGRSSDWLLGAQLDLPGGFGFDSRTVIGDSGVDRSETRVDWKSDRVDLAATHIYLAADSDENRLASVSEWQIDGGWQATDIWKLSANARYDVVRDQAVKAGVGLQWRNECANIDLSVSRSFTSSANVTPTTNFGLSVSLEGFSTSNRGIIAKRACDGP